jgi:NAD:arginine ADP-ribosyltransferase
MKLSDALLKRMIDLIMPVLLSRETRRTFGLTPAHALEPHYQALLSSVQTRLLGNSSALPLAFDDDDRVLVHWYTMDAFAKPNLDYRALNHLLRVGKHPNEASLRLLALYLYEAIVKLDPRPGISYRVVQSFSDFSATYRQGMPVTEKGFISSSRNPRVVFPGLIYFTLFGRSGRDIGAMSVFTIEDEVLFPPNLTFKVLLIDELSDGTVHVIMQEQ